MRAYFNIEIDGKIYGVLVSQCKYGYIYRKAKNPFKKNTANLEDELQYAFDNYPELKQKFLNGESIGL